MKLSTHYANEAAANLEQLEQLAAEQDALLGRRRALRNLEEALTDMTADGELTHEEIAAIASRFESLGLDASFLREAAHGSVEKGPGRALVDRIRKKIERHEADTRDADDQITFRAQILIHEYQAAELAASQLEKRGFDADMAAIRNLIA